MSGLPDRRGGSRHRAQDLIRRLDVMDIGLSLSQGLGWRCDSSPQRSDRGRLAHTLGDQAELAYRRSDALDKRRVLMNDWAAYCGPSKKR